MIWTLVYENMKTYIIYKHKCIIISSTYKDIKYAYPMNIYICLCMCVLLVCMYKFTCIYIYLYIYIYIYHI